MKFKRKTRGVREIERMRERELEKPRKKDRHTQEQDTGFFL